MVNGENQPLCVMMMAWRVVLFALGKHSISASSTMLKGGKRAFIRVMILALDLNYSGGFHDTTD